MSFSRQFGYRSLRPFEAVAPRVNYLHPLAKNLVFATAPATGHVHELTEGRIPSTIALNPEPGLGVAVESGTSSGLAYTPTQSFSDTSNGCQVQGTFVINFRTDLATGGGERIFFLDGSNFRIEQFFDDVALSDGSGSYFDVLTLPSSVDIEDGDFHTFAVTYGANETNTFYVDGVLGSDNSPGGTYVADGTFSTLSILCRIGEADIWDGVVALVYFFDRRMEAEELRELSTNPWQMLSPAVPEFLAVPSVAAGGAITGTVAATLPSITSSASGDIGRTGTAAATLPAIESAAAGIIGRVGSAAASLPALTASASGDVSGNITGTSAATLPAVTSASAGIIGRIGSSAVNLPSITSSASGSVGSAISGTVSATLPSLEASSAGIIGRTGSTAVDLPAITVSADGTIGRSGSAAISLPSITASATGSVDGAVVGTVTASLPSVTASAAGLIGRTGSVAATLPNITVSASGSLQGAITGSAEATLPGITVSIIGIREITGTASAVLPLIEVDAYYVEVVYSPNRGGQIARSKSGNIVRTKVGSIVREV